MRDLIPRAVFEALQDRYAAGVSNAEANYEQHSADEDSVTGALGEALAARDPITFSTPQGGYIVSVGYKKVRGRGANAPEKLFGADGIFQIEVTDSSGNRIRAKGLPFQAKKNRHTQWTPIYLEAGCTAETENLHKYAESFD